MLGKINKQHVSPKGEVPKFSPPPPRRNGINDPLKTLPTIYGVPNGGIKYVVNVTDDFDKSHVYDEVVALLANATELDDIWWNISSNGGYVDSLQMLLGWKAMCVANQVHVLHSNADSCASVFFLSPANQYIVGDGATMFIHETQTGSFGTTSNVERRTEHLVKQNKKFVKETYQDFLLPDELDDVLKGLEVYLDAEEIRTRLEKREALKQEQFNESVNHVMEKPDLTQFTEDELKEELEAIEDDVKTFQSDRKEIVAELKRRSKTIKELK